MKTYAIFQGKNREGFVSPARDRNIRRVPHPLSCFAFQMARHSSPLSSPLPALLIFIIDPRIRCPLIRLHISTLITRESFRAPSNRGDGGDTPRQSVAKCCLSTESRDLSSNCPILVQEYDCNQVQNELGRILGNFVHALYRIFFGKYV